MGVSYRPQVIQTSGPSSECLLEVPFEAYTDSPDIDVSKGNVRVESVPRDRVGPRASRWRRTLEGWIPSFTPRRNEDDDDDLPSLSGNLPQRRKRFCRSRFSRYFVRSLLGFFVML